MSVKGTVSMRRPAELDDREDKMGHLTALTGADAPRGVGDLRQVVGVRYNRTPTLPNLPSAQRAMRRTG